MNAFVILVASQPTVVTATLYQSCSAPVLQHDDTTPIWAPLVESVWGWVLYYLAPYLVEKDVILARYHPAHHQNSPATFGSYILSTSNASPIRFKFLELQ
ncbi:hypothetical protein AMTR_s00023p00239060 [Amborella trichopoda]|uniref:Fatty acid hydroxylase domain-containing protein n=1 Tax=Amborella trichopoda TaxID=13333 RepID=W1NJQ0_AMBTC|nr:hypothetical protein AMTR_s00023p00239060 [Amborella trichopoda]